MGLFPKAMICEDEGSSFKCVNPIFSPRITDEKTRNYPETLKIVPCTGNDCKNCEEHIIISINNTKVSYLDIDDRWDTDISIKMSMFENVSNVPSNMENNLYGNGIISGEAFYQSVNFETKPHCLEKSFSEVRDNEPGNAPQEPPGKQLLSPRRSTSPYSISSSREPGNISSQDFQANWKTSNNLDCENSSIDGGLCNSDDIFIQHNDKPNECLTCEKSCCDKKTSNENVKKNNRKHSTGNERDVSAICSSKSDERNPIHPYIPVVEVEAKQPPISSNVLTVRSKYVKSEDLKKSIASEESKTVQTIKNDSLIRISHFLRVDNKLKRVVDVKTVTELMDIYKSLLQPIILPFVRQRSYYDQWARFPSGDVNTRQPTIYPRSNTNLSMKCWTLFQAIQSDQINQMKSNSAPVAPTGSKLVVPNPADVTCQSLESIIDHYNQIATLQNPIFRDRTKTPPATPLKTVTSKVSSAQSSSSRSSSGNSNDRHRTNAYNNSQVKDCVGILNSHEKHSPIPLRKKSNTRHSKCKSYNKSNDVDQCRNTDFVEIQNIQENNRSIGETTMENQNQQTDTISEISMPTTSIPTAELFSSEDNGNSSTILNRDHFTNDVSSDECNDKKGRNPSVTITIRTDDDDTNKREESSCLKTPEKRGFSSPSREVSRNPYDVNTSTVRLNLPHDLDYSKNDTNETSAAFNQGEKRGHSYQNTTSSNNGIVGLARRSKTRLLLNQLSPKSERREVSFITSSLQNNPNPHYLKQSLLINELQCSKDIDGKYYHTRHKPPRTSGRSSSSTSWKSTPKPPELPTRGYSMCERLEPSENPAGRLTLSPETCRPRSERQSAVSLANVHFLDLTDLKTMLRKTNTPIPRL